MWTALGSFLLAFFVAAGYPNPVLPAGVLTFAAIAAGGLGSVVAGQWADRWGREQVASAAMLVSGCCALVMEWMLAAPLWVVLPLAILWGTTIVADSAPFSALVTEVAPVHAVGTALTLRTSLGFALTAGSIPLTFAVVEAWGWGPAFAMLALGPVFGIWSMMRLEHRRPRPRERTLDQPARCGGGRGRSVASVSTLVGECPPCIVGNIRKITQ
jgi:MFS family permease